MACTAGAMHTTLYNCMAVTLVLLWASEHLERVGSKTSEYVLSVRFQSYVAEAYATYGDFPLFGMISFGVTETFSMASDLRQMIKYNLDSLHYRTDISVNFYTCTGPQQLVKRIPCPQFVFAHVLLPDIFMVYLAAARSKTIVHVSTRSMSIKMFIHPILNAPAKG